MELDNCCSICLDIWEEASYVTPCLHQFCYLCILQWAERKPECPLCKRKISIMLSVQADDNFEEHVVTPSAASSVVSHQAGVAPGHTAAHRLRHSAGTQPQPVGLVPTAPLGSLRPNTWASLFWDHPALLQPLLTWVHQELGLIFGNQRSRADIVEGLIMSLLVLFGLDEDLLVSLLGASLQNRTASSQRRSPTPGPDPSVSPERTSVDVLPSTSAGALHGGPGSPSAPIPISGEQEEPLEESEEAMAHPSASGWGSECSPGEPWRPPKRRAGSPEAYSPARKRPPHQQH